MPNNKAVQTRGTQVTGRAGPLCRQQRTSAGECELVHTGQSRRSVTLAATEKSFSPMALAFDRDLIEPLMVLTALGVFLALPFLIPA